MNLYLGIIIGDFAPVVVDITALVVVSTIGGVILGAMRSYRKRRTPVAEKEG